MVWDGVGVEKGFEEFGECFGELMGKFWVRDRLRISKFGRWCRRVGLEERLWRG